MECPRCHNRNVNRLYKLNGKYYCRECIAFHRVFVDEKIVPEGFQYPSKAVQYHLDFELSASQKQISRQLVENYQNQLHSLVLAVCGSGKTEIVFELIQYALEQGHRVCFCIPRKELVKELYQRIYHSFRFVDIGLVYGGHTENIEAQFIICTMHQLYRFESTGFDLIIADEVDAFPFYGNRVLQEIFTNCCRGNYVKLSATFVKEDIHQEELLIMNRRYHGYDLPVPRLMICPRCLQIFIIHLLLWKWKKKVIIYVPFVKDVDKVVHQLRCFRVKGVSSMHKHNQENLEALKNGDIDVIVSTTLLERGITVEDVQVIVYHGEDNLFDCRTLIQIAGRVGRKISHPQGHVYILSCEHTSSIRQCIHTIKDLNTMNV
ncbi:DEAD/DEAH box helicase family protein [Allocoprobacillus halotolerans]|uniref:DEAD/DEAH box helicase family protein n=1 Tax=Allocoprobacillus halotolerans TaxID=2944914 RepID=A0ABY5I6N7_9FIRM|nr:helicase-related protein [Allocoprobacillus halotolerans]UTY39886.1 DEAD/DEAH box helicase family protein [Allocoprobacillus halotolerans]